MQQIRNGFLFTLRKTDRLLFYALMIYAFGLFYFSLKQCEEFPFLLFGMYSLKAEKAPDTINTYEIVVGFDTVRMNDLRDPQREIVATGLDHFLAQPADSARKSAYAQWLFRYLADMRMVEENKIEVVQISGTKTAGDPHYDLTRKIVLRYERN